MANYFVSYSLSVFTVCSVLFIQLQLVDCSINLPKAEKGTPKCQQTGKVCGECNTVSYCTQTSMGEWMLHDLYSCESGFTCLESINDCSSRPNPKCDKHIKNYKFVCQQVGTFPDAFDCTKYHVCNPEEDTDDASPIKEPHTFSCYKGFSYNPATTLCQIRLTEGQCDSRLPPCSKDQMVGVIPGHEKMFYVCLKNDRNDFVFPQIFVCPFDQVFYENRCGPLQSITTTIKTVTYANHNLDYADNPWNE